MKHMLQYVICNDHGKKNDVTNSRCLGTILGACVWDRVTLEAVVWYQLTIFTLKMTLSCYDSNAYAIVKIFYALLWMEIDRTYLINRRANG